MWRRLLRLAHPDGAGNHELFIWVDGLREHVAGDEFEDMRTAAERRSPPPHPPKAGERIDFSGAWGLDFDELTWRAVQEVYAVPQPYARLFGMLGDCFAAEPYNIGLVRQQVQGATYRSLAAIAHPVGMSKADRVTWYRLAEAAERSWSSDPDRQHARRLRIEAGEDHDAELRTALEDALFRRRARRAGPGPFG